MQYVKFILTIVISYWLSFPVSAQPEHPMTFLRKVKKANVANVISYDYSVTQINVAGNRTDSTTGKLYRNSRGYLDSNSTTVTASVDGYYLNLNKYYKTATVISFDTLKKHLGPSWDKQSESIVAIPDSVILKYGKVKFENLPSGNYRINMSFENLQYEKIVLDLDKNSLKLISMQVTSSDASGYKQLYNIYNIRYGFNQDIISLSRFFTIKNKQVVLNRMYSGYEIKTITN